MGLNMNITPAQRFLDKQKEPLKLTESKQLNERLSYDEKYGRKLATYPREFPAHPFCVSLSKRGLKTEFVYVSASSYARAELAGIYHFNSTKRKKIKFDKVSALPMMPIEKNMFWDRYERVSNPEHLMLHDYKQKFMTKL